MPVSDIVTPSTRGLVRSIVAEATNVAPGNGAQVFFDDIGRSSTRAGLRAAEDAGEEVAIKLSSYDSELADPFSNPGASFIGQTIFQAPNVAQQDVPLPGDVLRIFLSNPSSNSNNHDLRATIDLISQPT